MRTFLLSVTLLPLLPLSLACTQPSTAYLVVTTARPLHFRPKGTQMEVVVQEGTRTMEARHVADAISVLMFARNILARRLREGDYHEATQQLDLFVTFEVLRDENKVLDVALELQRRLHPSNLDSTQNDRSLAELKDEIRKRIHNADLRNVKRGLERQPVELGSIGWPFN